MARSSHLAQRGSALVERKGPDHYIFLIDTSGSMRGIAKGFTGIHGEFLDALAKENPGAIVSCFTFDEKPYEQYSSLPIETAPALDMRAHLGTDLPNALMEGIGIYSLGEGDTVIVITDGDVDPHHSNHTVYESMRAIQRAKAMGARFLFLISGMERGKAVLEARRIGLDEADVLVWEHTVDGIRSALSEAGDVLALQAAKRGERTWR